LRQRPVPRGEGAVRIPVATEEHLAPPTPALREVAHLARRTGDADRERLAALALRVPGAGQEPAQPPALDGHHLPALLAVDVGGDLLPLDVTHLLLGLRQRRLERSVEVAQHPAPVRLALGDLVELLLHP